MEEERRLGAVESSRIKVSDARLDQVSTSSLCLQPKQTNAQPFPNSSSAARGRGGGRGGGGGGRGGAQLKRDIGENRLALTDEVLESENQILQVSVYFFSLNL